VTSPSCVHCGLCHSACPTYVELGNEADSPRGRIALMQSLEAGTLALSDAARGHLDLCLGCRACETACPSGVRYGEMIEAMRPRLDASRPPLARAWRRLLGWALTSRVGTLPLRLAALLPGRSSLARLGSWGAFVAALPAPRAARVPARLEPEGRPCGTALLLTGCVSDALFRPTTVSAARLLQRAGWRVLVPPEQRCCGALGAHLGQADDARAKARELVRVVAAHRPDVVVTTAAGCGAHLLGYGHLLPDDPAAAELAGRARDVLAVLADSDLPAPSGRYARRVAVHDPCHLAHGQGVHGEVRRLLAAIPGITVVPLEDSDVCCGSAGTYNLTERDMAARLLERKIRHVEASGAEVIAAANPGCLLQIRAGLLARGSEVTVEHPVDVLARAHGWTH
jgi:glycolate oxidase iron-sulfur subunit